MVTIPNPPILQCSQNQEYVEQVDGPRQTREVLSEKFQIKWQEQARLRNLERYARADMEAEARRLESFKMFNFGAAIAAAAAKDGLTVVALA